MAPTGTTLARDALLALIDWYVGSGVDIALDDAPHDRYADRARTPAPAIEQPAAPREPLAAAEPARLAPRRPTSVVAAPDEAARAAEDAAASAQDIDALASRLAEFPHAPFRDMAAHFLLTAGTPGASLMILEAAPGVTEEATGEAFSGLQAALLDNMLAAIGQGRKSAWLAYVAPWRPPGDRALTPQETAIFAPFARRHVELARPRVLLMFGETPARVMLSTAEPISKLRSKPFDVRCGSHAATGFVFNSLDATLKSPALKPAAWRDLRAAAAALGE